MLQFDREKLTSVLLMVLGTLMLLALNVSCAPRVAKGKSLDGAIGGRDAVIRQQARSVAVYTECVDKGFTGTGSLLGANLVLTAAHNVPCNGDTKIRLADRRTIKVIPIAVDYENDALLLQMVGVTTNIPAPKVAWEPPKPGDVLCAATSHPFITRKCGKVLRIGIPGPGEIIAGFEGVSGNSGSGVYNEAGELVGILSTGCRKRGCNLAGISSVAKALKGLGFVK